MRYSINLRHPVCPPRLILLLIVCVVCCTGNCTAQTVSANLKLNTPISFFSLPSKLSTAGQIGVELSFAKEFVAQVNLQTGQFSNFESSTTGKQGNFKNEFILVGASVGYNVLGSVSRYHELYVSTGCHYMPCTVKYYKTDDSIREINISFWLNSVGVEYRYPITRKIDICAFTEMFISQSSWLDGYPADDSYDHFMTVGGGVSINLSGRY